MDRAGASLRRPARVLVAWLLVAMVTGPAGTLAVPPHTEPVVQPTSLGPAATARGTAVTGTRQASAPAHRLAPRPSPPHDASQAVIVKFRPGTPATAKAAARARARVERSRPLRSIGAEVVRPLPGRSAAQAVAALAADPAVEYAEPDAPVVPAGDPAAEPYLGTYQWALRNDGTNCAGELPCVAGVDIDAVDAWSIATGAGVTVAVPDDGVDLTNPELATQAWTNPGETGLDGSGNDRATNGIDDDGNGYVDDVHGVNLCADATPQTLHVAGGDWHGSAVASVLAAAANGSGMVGAAPDARIMVVRWLEPRCATVSYAVTAIGYAIANGAHVINASWGTFTPSAALLDAVRGAAAAGVLIVAAAGNEDSSLVLYPAAFDAPNVLSVAAIAADGRLADFSSWGTTVDLAAPGSSILAIDVIHGGYGLVDGTSFSTPLVSAIAALVGERRPDLLADPAAMRLRIIGSGWRDSNVAPPSTASGRVADARNALDLTPPVAPSRITGVGQTGSTLGASSATIRVTWPAATDDIGIDAYRVSYRRAGTTAWSTATGWTTSRAVSLRLRTGTSYEIRITTRDAGTNRTSAVYRFRAVRHQERYATYHGRWRGTSWASASGGHTEYATRAGSRATITFTGRSVALVMPRSRSQGAVRVYVDGSYAKTLHLHASKTHPRRIVFHRAWAATASHTIRLVVAGTAGHPRVDLDAIVVGR